MTSVGIRHLCRQKAETNSCLELNDQELSYLLYHAKKEGMANLSSALGSVCTCNFLWPYDCFMKKFPIGSDAHFIKKQLQVARTIANVNEAWGRDRVHVVTAVGCPCSQISRCSYHLYLLYSTRWFSWDTAAVHHERVQGDRSSVAPSRS